MQGMTPNVVLDYYGPAATSSEIYPGTFSPSKLMPRTSMPHLPLSPADLAFPQLTAEPINTGEGTKGNSGVAQSASTADSQAAAAQQHQQATHGQHNGTKQSAQMSPAATAGTSQSSGSKGTELLLTFASNLSKESESALNKTASLVGGTRVSSAVHDSQQSALTAGTSEVSDGMGGGGAVLSPLPELPKSKFGSQPLGKAPPLPKPPSTARTKRISVDTDTSKVRMTRKRHLIAFLHFQPHTNDASPRLALHDPVLILPSG